MTFYIKYGIFIYGGKTMRTLNSKIIAANDNMKNVLSLIRNTPKPDFTKIDKICSCFENKILSEQAKDRKKISGDEDIK